MIPIRRRTVLCASLAAGLALPPFARAGAPPAPPDAAAGGERRNRVVFQVSEGDPARWALALNNARNVLDGLGEESVALEIVAYGPGIGMLKADSPVAERIAALARSGARVVACQNTMKAQHLAASDMLPGIGYVPAGVVELMQRQQQGWAYIRP